ncbi:hypothetical protein A3I56_02880 [Candidatus Roizmanbacteria bacterium RIFCSPLOWO2_02_FULL_43_10]|uniref:Four helix bundle protein n=3 Tax=Candidatus Roizmaniibacteriota TaxID=1752723 RepID=A0A1F7JZV1_9BACT|nr:MAG: hypothetical protein A3D08_03660 [Candidatus Roizmanbacteria bacterium RIFCSPHIGHO2_02_FULL_43_11]OGK38733.1 MAG: hypothetical protein A3F32_02390 [Candidatus Roizmanbacteria bacterium RIFCSPHIGHO2_12_FULL_42_10]OGK61139.1 MAG: hypothetical protein A3I56_02880 [Candidatus Roizmanbacteria bacterium RIFCSPLOWO2_02_FULL_43_10]
MQKVKDLVVYQAALSNLYKVYLLALKHPLLSKDYALRDQLKRAALSVTLNIVEGFATSKKQFAYYLLIAIGSANEVLILLEIIQKIYAIDTSELYEEYLFLAKRLSILRRKILTS